MLSMAVMIRTVLPSDAERLTAMIHRVWAATYFPGRALSAPAQDYLSATFCAERLRVHAGDSRFVLVVAESEQELAGFAQLGRTEPDPAVTGARPIELEHIYVEQRWHGAGVGAELLQWCCNRAASDGFHTLWLSVLASNQRARSFYRKWHFEDVGTLYFQLGDDQHENRVLQRALKGFNDS